MSSFPLRPVWAAPFALWLAGCGVQAETAAPAEPVPVRTAAPTFLPRADITGVGRLEALSERRLGFVTGGVLRHIRVDIGDRVAAGQVLAELDTTALDATVEQAEQSYELARRDLARAEDLVGRALVSKQQAEDARTRARLAEAEVRAARYARRYGTVIAAEPGVVLARLAEPREVLAAGQPVLQLSTQGSGWRLRVELADRDALRLHPGGRASVSFRALPGTRLPARIREIGGEASEMSGAITVDLLLEPTDAPLRSGLIAHARLSLPDDPSLGVPTSALMRAEGRQGAVLVVNEARAALREVTLGEVAEDHVEVLQGLSPTDEVIVEGGAWVDAGAPIRRIGAR